MTGVAAHVEQFHPATFEFSEHQMPHLVWRKLGDLKSIADPIKNIFDGPFREWLTRVAVRVRQKNAPILLSSVVCDKCCTVLLTILFEMGPCRMGEHNDPRHVVFRDFGTDGDGMDPSVDIVNAQLHDLFST